MEIKEEGNPEAGLLPIPDCRSGDFELSEEQSKLSLLALHTGYMVEVAKGSPKLVQIQKQKEISDAS